MKRFSSGNKNAGSYDEKHPLQLQLQHHHQNQHNQHQDRHRKLETAPSFTRIRRSESTSNISSTPKTISILKPSPCRPTKLSRATFSTSTTSNRKVNQYHHQRLRRSSNSSISENTVESKNGYPRLGGVRKVVQSRRSSDRSVLTGDLPPPSGAVFPSDVVPFLSSSPKTRSIMEVVINSKLYIVSRFCFTLVLLFGNEIQVLFFYKETDIYWFILYIMTVFVLLLDIVLVSYTSTNYFLCLCSGAVAGVFSGRSALAHYEQDDMPSYNENDYNQNNNSEYTNQNSNTSISKCSILQFRIGTVNFWFDFISTLALLIEVLIDHSPNLIYSSHLTVYLDRCITNDIQSPVKPQVFILLTIARTMRIAQWLSPRVVVKFWFRINLFIVTKMREYSEKREVKRVQKNIKALPPMAKASICVVKSIMDGLHSLRHSSNRTVSGREACLDREELTREDAAVKIQRAFREAYGLKYRSNRMIYMKDDVAEEKEGLLSNPQSQQQTIKTKNDDSLLLAAHSNKNNNSKRSSKRQMWSFTNRVFSTRKEKNQHRSKSNKITVKKNEKKISSEVEKYKTKASQLGSKMMKVTGEKIAMGIIFVLVLTVVLTYHEWNHTWEQTMITLHTIQHQKKSNYTKRTLELIYNSTPELSSYIINGTKTELDREHDYNDLRENERFKITICSDTCKGNSSTVGYFNIRETQRQTAWASLMLTIYIIVIWCVAVLYYSSPMSALIVIPIERMVRFLGMLVKDPLGYQRTAEFRQFSEEEEGTLKKIGWSKEVLDGMETSFLMSTISRISNLMKVGFGSAGVEIIRSNLGEATKGVAFENLVGSSVSCIFLFSDIRSFTDASECLQEEVFVFTNRVASVVHSICSSFGGSANKNIGDAFLISWLLDSTGDGDDNNNDDSSLEEHRTGFIKQKSKLLSKDHQADKALLACVRISIALHHDSFYLEGMSENAKRRLKEKMSQRQGPLVQMGFGLHAGKAVQGAIGSERKLDATYISKAVDLAEYLEGTTKKYGLSVVMSGEFFGMLAKSTKRRCRKIDQVTFTHKDIMEDNIYDVLDHDTEDTMELYTHDFVVEDLWVDNTIDDNTAISNMGEDQSRSDFSSKTPTSASQGIGSQNVRRPPGLRSRRRWSVSFDSPNNDNIDTETKNEIDRPGLGELSLPSGPVPYNASIWLKDDLRKVRRKFTDGRFYGPFNTAVQLYFKGEWNEAKVHFERVAERFEDKPSKHFLEEMKATNYIPPITFNGYSPA